MAVTQGHGNPDWSRDEVILALDLYFQVGGQIPGPTDSRVIALSSQLRALPVHRGASKQETFRNPSGVAFKLQNLRQVATGRGLGNVSSLDRQIWADYGEKPEEVRALSKAILASVQSGGLAESDIEALQDDEEFMEGRVLTAVHRRRERSPALRRRLLEKREGAGTLACDCCRAGPVAVLPELRMAGFEAHHVMPLAEAAEATRTKLSDLALLCAVCHRLIHRAMQLRRRWVSVEELQGLLGFVAPRA